VSKIGAPPTGAEESCCRHLVAFTWKIKTMDRATKSTKFSALPEAGKSSA